MPPKHARRHYSEEELQQIVHEHHVLCKPVATISRDLNIPKSTVSDTIKRWGETGKVRARKERPTRPGEALTDEARDYLKAMVELNQAITLRGTAERLETSFGIRPTLTTIRSALNKLGYSKLSEATFDDSRRESSGQSREPSVSGHS